MPTATIYASAGDGEIRHGGSSTVFSTLRSASTGTSKDDSSATVFGCYVSGSGVDYPSGYLLARGYLPFDLSSLPADAVITDIQLYIKPSAVYTGLGGSVCVCSSSQASLTALATSDWGGAGSTEYVDSRPAFSSFTAGTYKQLALNAAAISAATVGAGGKLRLCLRTSFDLDNSAPVLFSYSGIGINASEQSGTGSDPYIVVTYVRNPRTGADSIALSDAAVPTYWQAARKAVVVRAAGKKTTLSGSHSFPTGTINVADTTGFPSSGTIIVVDTLTPPYAQTEIAYTGKTGTSFTGCTGGTGTFASGNSVCTPDNESHFPQVVNLDPASTTPRFLVSYTQHAAHAGRNGSLKYKKTSDGGLTYGAEGTIRSGPVNGSLYGIFGHNLFRCSDGTLIATWYESSSEAGTGGHAKWEYETLSYSSRSTDDGATWDTPVAIPTQFGIDYMAVGVTGMVEYGGDVYVTAYGLDTGYNTDSPNHHYSKLLKTTDKGATTGNWSVASTIATTTQTDGRANGEASLLIMPDGTWVSHLRCEINTGAGFTTLDRYQATAPGPTGPWSGHTRIIQGLANSSGTVRRQSGLILTQGGNAATRSGVSSGNNITFFTSDLNNWPSTQWRKETIDATYDQYNGSAFAAVTPTGPFDTFNVYAAERSTQDGAQIWSQWYEIPGFRAGFDALALSDTAPRAAQTFTRTGSDALALSDTAARILPHDRAATDALEFTDTAVRDATTASRTAGDTLAFTDTLAGAAGRSRTGADTLAFSDGTSHSLTGVVPSTVTMNMRMPPGTVVGAYLRHQWRGSEVPVRGAGSYPGPVVEEATVDAYGEVEFSLSRGSYIAWAEDFPLRRRFFVVTD